MCIIMSFQLFQKILNRQKNIIEFLLPHFPSFVRRGLRGGLLQLIENLSLVLIANRLKHTGIPEILIVYYSND